MTSDQPFADRDALAALCHRHRIRRLLFGSVLHGADRPDRDVDLLIEFEAGGTPGLLGLAAIEMHLSDLLRGQRVDLRTPQELSRYFRDEGAHRPGNMPPEDHTGSGVAAPREIPG
jgi:uncharacterized protein